MYLAEYGYNYYSDKWRGLFFAPFNWIWIKGWIDDIERTKNHEYFHSYSLSLRPAYLIPFYNYLLCPSTCISAANCRQTYLRAKRCNC